MAHRRPTRLPESNSTEPPRGGEWRSLATLLPYLREFPARVSLALACLVLAKLSGVALPLVLKHLVDSLGSHATLIAVPLALLAGYGLLRFANVLFGELRDVVFGRVTERAIRRASLDVFRHLHTLDLDFHLTRRTGGLSRDIERGIAGISFLLRFLLFNVVPTLLEIALVSVILWSLYGGSYALIAALAVGLYIIFSVAITEWRTRFVREANQLDSRANTRAIDSLLNYETVKLFGAEAEEAAAYDHTLAAWEIAQRQNRLSLSALNVGQALIIAGAVTGLMWMAAEDVVAQRATLGDFVAINAFMMQLFVPLNVLGFVYREMRRALTDMQRMFGLRQQVAKVQDAPNSTTLLDTSVRVSFERVAFRYHPERPILRDVSFEIPQGKKLAVVGSSGAGKSTLARLLFRFYDVESGRIALNGKDLRALTQDSLRAHIGVVPQDTVLFNDTLAYNIGYGKTGASRADIERVTKLAHLDGFIAQLPRGYDTEVGERGLKLSGGEKQRVAIARALLKDPPLMIFDEATSSLDSVSERAILEALREAARARTTLVIAHRLSTVTDADEIVVLERGLIAERGTHAQLLSANGVYARLWALQQRSETPPA